MALNIAVYYYRIILNDASRLYFFVSIAIRRHACLIEWRVDRN